MSRKTYALFDGSTVLTGSPAEVTDALWRGCKSHQALPTRQEYMEWQSNIERRYSASEVPTDSPERFVEGLVACGFLTPLD